MLGPELARHGNGGFLPARLSLLSPPLRPRLLQAVATPGGKGHVKRTSVVDLAAPTKLRVKATADVVYALPVCGAVAAVGVAIQLAQDGCRGHSRRLGYAGATASAGHQADELTIRASDRSDKQAASARGCRKRKRYQDVCVGLLH